MESRNPLLIRITGMDHILSTLVSFGGLNIPLEVIPFIFFPPLHKSIEFYSVAHQMGPNFKLKILKPVYTQKVFSPPSWPPNALWSLDCSSPEIVLENGSCLKKLIT